MKRYIVVDPFQLEPHGAWSMLHKPAFFRTQSRAPPGLQKQTRSEIAFGSVA